ncbi:MAG: GGDEF domain-containing protein [Ruminococcus sp.]|nr:GGDEF domain-containing protein [Ruminococcus sp.]
MLRTGSLLTDIADTEGEIMNEDNSRYLNIAVIVAGIDEEYQYNIICGINKYARENDINVSYFAAFGGILGSRKFDTGEYRIYQLADFTKFDGVILMNNTISDSAVKEMISDKIRRSGVPTVVFDSGDIPEFCNISINNNEAMKEIVRHVIREHGAKKLNYISGPLSNPEAVDRYRAFIEVMAENGLSVDEERVYFGEFRSIDGRMAIENFSRSKGETPDAIICANDAMALAAISALEKIGYKVPDDVIVTGFDCTYNARNYSPSLTTVKRPLYAAGYTAVGKLAEAIGGKAIESCKLVAAPVFAESCGCPDCTGEDIKDFRKRIYRKTETTNMNISFLNRLTAGLAETETSSDHFDVIESFIEELDCEKFCLCLTEDWRDSLDLPSDPEEEYASYMTAPLIWDKGERRSVGYYPSSKMFPELMETGGNINYFLPLHFRDRTLGYYIITNGDFPINSLLCHTLTMNISNSIENIRKLFHLNKAMDELDRLYSIDPLCNIFNRNGFIKRADEMFRKCAEKKKSIMLSFIDMDRLKYINDNYGHNEGDFALQRLATVISECCESNSICARFGGDEFVIFTAGADEDDGEALIRRFNSKIENMNRIIKKPYRLSASIGNAVENADGNTTLFDIIQRADDKMYELKKTRRAELEKIYPSETSTESEEDSKAGL